MFDNLFGVRLYQFGELACFLIPLLFSGFRCFGELETAVRHILLHVLEVSIQVRVLRNVAVFQHKIGNTVLLRHRRNLGIALRLRFLCLHLGQLVSKRLDTSGDTVGYTENYVRAYLAGDASGMVRVRAESLYEGGVRAVRIE